MNRVNTKKSLLSSTIFLISSLGTWKVCGSLDSCQNPASHSGYFVRSLGGVELVDLKGNLAFLSMKEDSVLLQPSNNIHWTVNKNLLWLTSGTHLIDCTYWSKTSSQTASLTANNFIQHKPFIWILKEFPSTVIKKKPSTQSILQKSLAIWLSLRS